MTLQTKVLLSPYPCWHRYSRAEKNASARLFSDDLLLNFRFRNWKHTLCIVPFHLIWRYIFGTRKQPLTLAICSANCSCPSSSRL